MQYNVIPITREKKKKKQKRNNVEVDREKKRKWKDHGWKKFPYESIMIDFLFWYGFEDLKHLIQNFVLSSVCIIK